MHNDCVPQQLAEPFGLLLEDKLFATCNEEGFKRETLQVELRGL